MKKEFVLTKNQLDRIIKASKPVPYMVFGGVEPSSPQENANAAWEAVAKELGVEMMSIEPVRGKGNEYILATPLNPTP